MGKFRIPFSTNQLMKIASVGGVYVLGNALLVKWLINKRLHQSPYYILAKDTVMKNQALVQFMGEPLYFGTADLGDNSRNFSTMEEAKFEIPLKGSKNEGTLYVSAVRLLDKPSSELTTDPSKTATPNNSTQWLLKTLEVTVKDRPNEKLVLIRDSDVG